jgi:hypothetical protein
MRVVTQAPVVEHEAPFKNTCRSVKNRNMLFVPTWPDIKTTVLARAKSNLVYLTSSWCHMPVVFNFGYAYPRGCAKTS